MASAQANVRISWRGIGAVAMLLASALLYGCGGGNAAPTPTAGAIPAQIAPVVSAVAPAVTRVATVVAPIETRVATVAAPVETRVATIAAPVETRGAAVFDPIVATLEARVGGVRPAQGACPADHPVKGRLDLVPPRREYWSPGSTGYEQAMATICFVTEADAQKALYRQAGS
ncbi:MAG: hypothetical protein M3176_08005 [Chloroflexota bacterium]|nr:hypothetical protein [Chloroflexota bacterium]MDQ6906755.1 hypothetical protein [Chloroflexota bacterium]